MKFGGIAVQNPNSFANIAEIILNRAKCFDYVVVVVSAMGNMTDQLISLSKRVHPHPPQREHDMLISAGERVSISLLAMALDLKGVGAVSFTGSQSGILTTHQHCNARIVDVKPHRIIELQDQKKIAIVAGFQGVSKNKEITTLGRGGSDTSAVALGVALGADLIEFYKDVDGIYSANPKKNKNANLLDELTYEELLSIIDPDCPILHSRCVELAQKNCLPLRVRSFFNLDAKGSLVQDSKKNNLNLKVYESSNEF